MSNYSWKTLVIFYQFPFLFDKLRSLHEMSKKATSTVLYSFLKTFLRQVVTVWVLFRKREKNDKSTSYSKAIYFSRMVPDNYCCRELKVSPRRAIVGDLFAIALYFEMENALFDRFSGSTLEIPLTDFCCFHVYHRRSHRIDKSLVTVSWKVKMSCKFD